MTKLDAYESQILAAFETGQLKSVASKAELTKLRVVARATADKDRPTTALPRPGSGG